MCTENGIWQQVHFNCLFDPLASSLEKSGGLLEGWKTLNGDSAVNMSVVVTIAVLATLIILSVIVVVTFFTHRRMMTRTGDGAGRKVSQTSTAELIHGGGGGHGGDGHHGK